MPVRHFATGEDLERDVANGRIWGGLHFRFSTDTGGALGARRGLGVDHEFGPRWAGPAKES